MIKIIIVDDQEILKEGLKTILSSYDGIEIINIASNGKEALALLEIEMNMPDVILMDIQMPLMNGVECTKIIKKKYPSIKIIVLTTFDDDEYIFEALKGGASGYLLKDASPQEIASAIKTVFDGEALIQPKIASKLINQLSGVSILRTAKDTKLELLTEREREIATLIGQGKSNKEISTQLYLSEGTVKNHITNIISELELRDRTQIAIHAIKNGLV